MSQCAVLRPACRVERAELGLSAPGRNTALRGSPRDQKTLNQTKPSL